MCFAACDRRGARVVASIAATVWLLGCAQADEYALGQSISMGPFSFAVVSADEGQLGSDRTVDILFHLTRDDTAPFTTSFSESFGFGMEIVDAAGNTFYVSPQPVSPVYRAGRTRSERYRARVRLSPTLEGVRDATRIGRVPADFRLFIDNPAVEGVQPRRVVIPLQ